MKTPGEYSRAATLVALTALLPASALLAKEVNDAAVAAPTSPAISTQPAAAAKTHTLFMGTDVAIEKNKAFHKVRDVSGKSFVINVDGKPVFIPVNLTAMNLKVEQSLKLTAVSATINDLKGERAYTARADPKMKQMREGLAVTAAIGDAASLSMGKYIVAQNKFGVMIDPEAAGGWAAISAANLEAAAKEAADVAYVQNQMATAMGSSDMGNSAYYRDRAEADLQKELFDAMEVQFEISSPTPLNNPYAVIITRFHERDAKPGTVRDWIYASSLDPIDSTPKKIRLFQGGFPIGFKLDSYQVHIYNRGEEVVTNVSPRRVPLTRDEAFEYVLIDYVSKNKGATVPAVPAMGVLPPDFNKRLSGGVLARTFYVKVAKTGEAVQLFEDEECSQPVQDEYVDRVVKNIRFKPALEKGKPVDGIAALQLGKLRI